MIDSYKLYFFSNKYDQVVFMQFFIAKIKMCQKDIMFIPTPQSLVFTIGDVIHLHSQPLSSNSLMRLRQFDIYFDCDFKCMPS